MRRAEDLLEDSDDFLGAARDLLLTGRWAKVCFMAQQAAELAVKAALNALGRERRMRSVHKLLEELAGLLFSCEDIAALIDDAKILTSIISRRGT
ncbi:MAG: HEPN domain-containing protein [Candidatus Jordarchaeales archaeon]